jgi:molecular chaperone GrpE
VTADDAARPPIVVRDNRRVDASGSTRGTASGSAGKSAGSGSKPAKDDAPAGEGGAGEPEVVEMTIAPTEGESGKPEATDTSAEPPSEEGTDDTDTEGAPVFAELSALRSDLDELTRDLQRVTAEYANYRKRVDRDRTQVQEQATGLVLAALLPVLDDLDRARSHGDLVGPFAAVADQLTGALGKFGLTAFGESGDSFDPQLHEAVSHTSSPEVTETTCVEIMRRGYLLGDRLLRPALVAVADPE